MVAIPRITKPTQSKVESNKKIHSYENIQFLIGKCCLSKFSIFFFKFWIFVFNKANFSLIENSIIVNGVEKCLNILYKLMENLKFLWNKQKFVWICINRFEKFYLNMWKKGFID